MKNLTRRLILVCVVATGCADEQDATPNVETAPDWPSGVFTGFATLPDDFPTDVPIHPESTILSAQQTDAGFDVGLLARDDFETVTTYYRDQLQENGWTIVTDDEVAVETRKVLRLSANSESRTCTIDISPVVGDDGAVRGHGITIYVTDLEQPE